MTVSDPSADVVLVTGSSGLIGRAVVTRLARRFRVVGLDRDGWPHPPPEAECICIDLTSDASVRAAFERVRYAYGDRLASVIHLAAYYDFSGEPSPLYDEVTVRGTGRLLQALQGFDVAQFVFSSTMLVHAPCAPGEHIDEQWPLKPKWDYPRSKVATEELIRRERGNISAVILRIAGVYDDACHSIPLANQIQRIFERKLTSRVFPGDISRGQAFVHLDDLTDAAVSVVDLRHRLGPDETVLIGEPETLSYDELQRSLGRLIHNDEWETRAIPKALAKAGAWLDDVIPGEEPFIKPWMIDLADDHYALDVSRARKELDWEPKRSLRETLPRMVSALKADPVLFYKENKLETPSGLEHENVDPEKMGPRSRGHKARGPDKPGNGSGTRPYTCPIHPEVREHASGPCPKCGMNLVHEKPRNALHGDEQPPDALEMVRQMRERWLWTNFTIMSLGLWLVSSPFTFGYPSGAMMRSDLVSGGLLVLFATLALWPRFDFVGRWGVSFVGGWLQFAPLVFWAPTAAAYLNDTLVGTLAITLSILVPMMPGTAHHMEMMKPGPEVPPGWSYNPSSWHQRAPMIGLALVGWLASRYLAAFQLGYIPTVREPFFGDGTVKVLTSDVSKMWPISDAGLGAAAYTVEMLMGWMGGKQRWRTMPWMVTFFFILVVPLGVTSIVLVILQPIAVGNWCSVCLFTAFVMLLMIPLAVDEVIAMGQFLRTSVRNGNPLWRTFWVGGTLGEVNEDDRTPKYGAPLSMLARPMVWGVTAPWNLVLSAALGVWLMVAPAVFDTQARAADSDHLVGALIVTVSVIVMAEVIRAGRYLNVLLGAWVITAPWVLHGAPLSATWNDAIAGACVIVLSFRRGPVRERYATWDRFII